jgi:hypothetical protein
MVRKKKDVRRESKKKQEMNLGCFDRESCLRKLETGFLYLLEGPESRGETFRYILDAPFFVGRTYFLSISSEASVPVHAETVTQGKGVWKELP